MKEIIFYKILEMSLQASFVVFAVLLVRFLLKNKPKIFSYLLWFAVFFRLLCPITIELPISFVPEIVGDGTVMETVTDTYVGNYQRYWNYSEEFDEALEQGLEPILQKDETGEIESAYVVLSEEENLQPETIYSAWLPRLFILWVFGMTVILWYSMFTYWKIRKNLVGAVPYDEEQEIYLSDYIQTAFVMGVCYPKIYLPSSLSVKEQEYVFLHEKHHIKRKDYVWKMIAFLAVCVHWFNPFAWISFVLFTKDMEMSCDEAVLRSCGEEIREEYAASLLGMTTGKKIFAASPLAFGEGSTKERIENAMQWKKPAAKVMVAMSVVCILIGLVSIANVESDSIGHPYEWTSTVSEEAIERCQAVSWSDETIEYVVTDSQIKDFVYVLNELSKSSIQKEVTPAKKEISVLFQCEGREYLLTYGNGITSISFEDTATMWTGDEVWQTKDEKLARCMKNLISQGVRVQNLENGISMGALAPTKEEVLLMRENVLKGMSEEEIKRVTELIQVENQNREYSYLKGSGYREYNDPESMHWNLYTQSGIVQTGWAMPCDAPGFDLNGEMTEEEYYETYGTKCISEIEVPLAERFYGIIEEVRSLIKSELLEKDLDTLEEYMRLAVEKHDVSYFHQMYYILHDMDYFLFRYGPEDVGRYTMDDSTVRKYYGVLSVYENQLPEISNVYEKTDSAWRKEYWESGIVCIERTYYQMTDGSFRTAVTEDGQTTNIVAFRYCVELEGVRPNTKEHVKCMVLCNTKEITFDDIVWGEKKINIDTKDAVLASTQLCKEK